MTINPDNESTYRLGSVSYSEWQAYPWKNELDAQRDRVKLHFRELLENTDTEHNPYDMLTRAFSIAAFCMRRLIECRLLSDEFCSSRIPMFEVDKLKGRPRRDPYICNSGGRFFETYDMSQRTGILWSPKEIADKFLHAKILAILCNSSALPNGLLVASDRQRHKAIFHISVDEYSNLVQLFLDDRVAIRSDFIDIETGRAHAMRSR